MGTFISVNPEGFLMTIVMVFYDMGNKNCDCDIFETNGKIVQNHRGE
jgi:hypothetical protein